MTSDRAFGPEMVHDLPSLWRQAYQAVCFIYKKNDYIFIYIYDINLYMKILKQIYCICKQDIKEVILIYIQKVK